MSTSNAGDEDSYQRSDKESTERLPLPGDGKGYSGSEGMKFRFLPFHNWIKPSFPDRFICMFFVRSYFS